MKWKQQQQKNDLLEQEFEPRIFSNFPAHDLNFHGKWKPEIKSKQASKRDRAYLINWYSPADIAAQEKNIIKISSLNMVKKWRMK